MNAIVFNPQTKIFAVVSADLAKAMIFMGNNEGFNRATEFPASSTEHMTSVFIANGFKQSH